MAPVQNEDELKLAPLALVTSHFVAASYLIYKVGRSLYKSHKNLSPSQDTRLRVAQRTKLTTTFGTLAVLGLVFAVNSTYKYLKLSYDVWASERGIGVPDSPFSTSRWAGTNVTSTTQLHLRQWLSDTPIYLDALEILTEKSRRLWWGQQLDLATISWTTLLAIEGRRRNIPHLWAYALLAHLVSLSFAQNLFYVALISIPSPLPSRKRTLLSRFFPPKPNNWLPNYPVIISCLVLNYAVSMWLPYAAGTSSFPAAASLGKLLSLAPLALNVVAPQSWGSVHRTPHSSYRVITIIFQFISAASAFLHAKNTLTGLFYNLPEPNRHRHSIKIPFDVEKRSRWERSTTSIEKVLGSINDHPAVTAAGKDVLLSALSLGLWAAVRAVDVGNILRSAMPLYKSNQEIPVDGRERPALPEPEVQAEKQSSEHPNGTSMTLRRSGRRTRGKTESIDGSNGSIHLDDFQTPKRRSRPRKAKGSLEASPEVDPSLDADNAAYKPTVTEKEELELGDVVPDDDFDWESASLAWALTVLGGLGMGSAAVFGGTCISR
ncbi:hypothetical protein QBC38DRAFT_354303 [Podospora fimiseda]|uniref:Uncharacterized protein n=1 Tax=Podospora fimiseda TaxID=252190 RepID=A0AAN7BXR3_9PEZI|nr:hypothetical protein QBC38DRAFT_354303 [Podospora fimiseda]